jgi:hypothetical protein
MTDYSTTVLKSHLKETVNIELKILKYWLTEAYHENIKKDDLIKWILNIKNTEYAEKYHASVIGLYTVTIEFIKTDEKHRIQKEIKKEAKDDPRFQAIAEEIDFLKSEVQVLKKMCVEKTE